MLAPSLSKKFGSSGNMMTTNNEYRKAGIDSGGSCSTQSDSYRLGALGKNLVVLVACGAIKEYKEVGIRGEEATPYWGKQGEFWGRRLKSSRSAAFCLLLALSFWGVKEDKRLGLSPRDPSLFSVGYSF